MNTCLKCGRFYCRCDELEDIDARDATIADLAAKLKRAVDVVRSVEWRGHNATCAHPNCHRTKWRAHAPDCPLAAVLKENP